MNTKKKGHTVQLTLKSSNPNPSLEEFNEWIKTLERVHGYKFRWMLDSKLNRYIVEPAEKAPRVAIRSAREG
jgi:hypothetical protein